MTFRRTPSVSRLLAEASPGEIVRIRFVALEFVRIPCWHLGIRTGDILRCVENGEDDLLVARDNGEHVVVPLECARFISIQSVETPEVEVSRPLFEWPGQQN